MNERILELRKQAGVLGINDITGLEGDKLVSKFLEKFAKLIVKECAMLVEGFEITQEVALDEYVDYEASAVLKQHFGVEE